MPVSLTYDDKTALINFLADQSEASDPTGPAYFQDLVKQANFDRAIWMKGVAGYKGGPKYNARRLVEFALSVGTNPKDGNAALGTILLPLLPELGVEDATLVAGILVLYQLVTENVLDEIRARYQIPERAIAAQPALDAAPAPLLVGPPVQWASETERLELQGWFTPEPEWIDVAVVINAVQRARSVCRVEVGAIEKGTGVLIGPDLVLTNYHVMGQTLAAPSSTLEANAPDTVLRFGAFRAKGAAAEGQEVRLSKDHPIVASSPSYDFALLRTDNSIARAKDISPFRTVGLMPVKESSLYVLQHPQGGPMKLALNTNGVTWVDPGLVTVQYTTKVARGSSGSPCFDEDWNLVALHHAGAGYKGEGILIQSIFERIRPYIEV